LNFSASPFSRDFIHWMQPNALFALAASTWDRRGCNITPSEDKLPIPTLHFVKMKMGAVKLVRPVVTPLLD
jgi:hypothetical protein